MKFHKRDQYHAVSECDRYTICVSTVRPGWRNYMASRRGSITVVDEPGERAAAYREAQLACENHAHGIAA